MPPTGLVQHPHCVRHDTGQAHPERPGRLTAVTQRLSASGLEAEVDSVLARPATLPELEAVHTATHVETVRLACERGPGAIDGDTNVSPGSWEAALLAAGGLVDACERVHARKWTNAFCAVRPPGHHAEADRAMGFCLFNNVAVAAAALRARGLTRVAILDWDVHHGNGTQHLFEDDPHVFYASLHQWPLYPGTGAASERGRGAGEGATLNCPMPAGSGDAEWLRQLDDAVLPALEAFEPELLLISAGFDAHRLDPLAGCELTEDGYRALTRRLLELAERTAGGRLVSVLEGGYSLEALASSVEAHVGELVAWRSEGIGSGCDG
jgi:acetoin utilization deacetylase AcuC-like enzyme